MKNDEVARRGTNRGDFAPLGQAEPLLQASGEYAASNHHVLIPRMHSSLQQDFAGHEPIVMFPTTLSSTVPDATLDQQQLVEAARVEYQQIQYPSSPRAATKLIGNPFVSWSDSLESNEVSRLGCVKLLCRDADQRQRAMQSSNISRGESQQSSHNTIKRSQTTRLRTSQETQPQSLDNGCAPSSLSDSRRATKRSRTTPHLRSSQLNHDELGERDELSEEPLASIGPASSRQRRSSKTEGNLTMSQKVTEESIQDSIRAIRASKAKKAQETNSSDMLNSDDLAIGLPKERYVPRPSRSRSARSTVEEPDYSVMPEKTAKQKMKRRKTGDVIAVQGHNLSQSASTPTQETNASTNEESTAPPMDKPLLTLGQTQSNTPAKKRKRGRPPKKRQEDVSNAISDDQQAGVTGKGQMDEVDELHQVMPSISEHQAPEHPVSHTEPLLHDPEFKDSLHTRLPSPVVQPTPASSAHRVGEVQQVEETKPKKRGRGRPRSTQNNVREAAAADVGESQTAADENEKAQEMQADTDLENGKSHDLEKTEGGAEEAILGAADDAAPALGSSRSSEKRSEEHEAGARAAKRGSTEPSPLGKGKVPVRVGLSRKARIAPLLKIVKK